MIAKAFDIALIFEGLILKSFPNVLAIQLSPKCIEFRIFAARKIETVFLMSIKQEINKRRTFGIVSHPDAGKTTLTEKLLLFGGAIPGCRCCKIEQD